MPLCVVVDPIRFWYAQQTQSRTNEAEANSPGSECAYVFDTRKRFGEAHK